MKITGPDSGSNGVRPRTMNWLPLIAGVTIGGIAMLVFVVLVGMPLPLGHRNDLPLEKLYGDTAVGIIVRTQAGAAQNPVGQNPRAIEAGRLSYTGSCAVCHGANGDGKGEFGQAIYPPASDLQAHDTQDKTDAQLFWIVKNGLSFAGMPGFGTQYNDQAIWSLVAYTRSLGKTAGNSSSLNVPTPTSEQLAQADSNGAAPQRGAAIYFAQGCDSCHGAVGNAPGELRLRGGGGEASQALRRGRPGMPVYGPEQISNAQLADLTTYMNSFGGGR